MRCNNCGKENNNSAQFCRFCGNVLGDVTVEKIACPVCGGSMDIDSRFCKHCGSDITQSNLNGASENYETANMVCPSCGKELRKGKKFCGFCGYKVPEMQEQFYQGETIEIAREKIVKNNTCPECGAEITAGKKFCGNCGTSLSTGYNTDDELFFDALEYNDQGKSQVDIILEELPEDNEECNSVSENSNVTEYNNEDITEEGNCEGKTELNEAYEEVSNEDEVMTDNDMPHEATEEAGLPYGNICPNCGAILREGIHFCGQCGTSLLGNLNFRDDSVEKSTKDITNIPVDELKMLKEMLDEGILSEEEFEATKKKLLGL